jgi:magnesium-transporting ATPase (P-type)
MTAFHEENNKKNIKNWSMIGAFLTFTYIFLIIFRWGVRTISHQTFLFLCWFLPLFIIIPSSLVAVLNFYKLDTNPISKPA